MVQKHLRRNIVNLKDCAGCHPTGRENERRRRRAGGEGTQRLLGRHDLDSFEPLRQRWLGLSCPAQDALP
jgi:hypothetical protein